MPQLLNRTVQVFLDVCILSIAYWLAFLFRFEFTVPQPWLSVLLLTWPYVIALEYGALTLMGVPRMSWRYISMSDAARVLSAVAISTGVLTAIRLGGRLISAQLEMILIPLGVIAMTSVLSFLGVVGVRALRRVHGESIDRRSRASGAERKRVLLIGAGQAGVMVSREIANRPDLGVHAVGFIDDDRSKLGNVIGGLTVLGPTADIAAIAKRKNVERVLITVANAPGHEIRRIIELCRDAQLETQIIPGLYEIVGEKVNLSRIREVAIEDVLRREPVRLDEDIVGAALRSCVVMVTGAGGSIGSELCRQICRFGPKRLLLVERFENALFEVHRELASAFPHVAISPCIADVCDRQRMRQLFESTKPELVFHAAAHKHVPMMELNPGEAVKNNVGGSKILADLADEFGVRRFVLISTDKAVNPTSIMGATKRIAEIYLQALSARSETRFVTVRFGNVLGSAGSVIPIFREQIAKGGPLTVTHPEMRRYFMTIPEASQLVMQAGSMGQGGEIFILDMGEPVRIVDLARDLITLSGLRPNDDIEIKFTGIRPGEKLFEELSTDNEHADKTRHPKIFIGRIKPHSWDAVTTAVDALTELAIGPSTEHLTTAIAAIVPEYQTERRRVTSKNKILDDRVSPAEGEESGRSTPLGGASRIPN